MTTIEDKVKKRLSCNFSWLGKIDRWGTQQQSLCPGWRQHLLSCWKGWSRIGPDRPLPPYPHHESYWQWPPSWLSRQHQWHQEWASVKYNKTLLPVSVALRESIADMAKEQVILTAREVEVSTLVAMAINFKNYGQYLCFSNNLKPILRLLFCWDDMYFANIAGIFCLARGYCRSSTKLEATIGVHCAI